MMIDHAGHVRWREREREKERETAVDDAGVAVGVSWVEFLVRLLLVLLLSATL